MLYLVPLYKPDALSGLIAHDTERRKDPDQQKNPYPLVSHIISGPTAKIPPFKKPVK
jgi:hypothetical protein